MATSRPTRALLDDERLTAVGLLMETQAGLGARLLPHLEAAGLPGPSFEVLLRLARSPGGRLRMSDLAAQSTLSSSGLTRLVDRLEGAGLVRRETCPTDRRGMFAALTDEGQARLDTALPQHLDDIEEHFTGALDADELAAFLATLRKLRDLVQPGAESGAQGPC